MNKIFLKKIFFSCLLAVFFLFLAPFFLKPGQYQVKAGSCQANVNSDSKVNIFDLLSVLIKFNKSCLDCPEDVNQDKKVDIQDLVFILVSWGTTCIGGGIQPSATDHTITKIIGQKDENETTYNKIVGNRTMQPGGVQVDTAQSPNKVYVFDSGNNRVLGFNSVGYCGSQDKIMGSEAGVDFSSEYQPGWHQKVFDSIYGQCNLGEWSNDFSVDGSDGFLKFTVNSAKKVISLDIYDRACPEQVASGSLELNTGEIIPFGTLENNGSIPAKVIVNKANLEWIKISVTGKNSSQGVGLGEIVINYENLPSSVVCSTDSDCSGGKICALDPLKEADFVFGQGSLTDRGGCNRSETSFALPDAATLCLNAGPYSISKAESPRFGSMDTDEQGNLYVLDHFNNRVLRYNNPFGSASGAGDAVADYVWGQPDFNSNDCNRGVGGHPSSDSLCTRGWEAGIHVYGSGVDIDSHHNLWVTDVLNHRVLRFPDSNSDGLPDQTADLVLGQASFTFGNNPSDYKCELPPTPENRLCKPNSVRVKDATGEVYVIDGETKGSGRVLVYSPSLTNGMNASQIIGQGSTPATGLDWPRGMAFDPDQANFDFWVNDSGHMRVVLFDHAGSMVRLIGQNTLDVFSSVPAGINDANDSRIIQGDGGIGIDSQGNLYTNDLKLHSSVMRFDLPVPLPNPSYLHPTNGKLLYSGLTVSEGWNKVSGDRPADWYGFSIFGNQLFASDGRRVLVWNNYQTKSIGDPADFVIGQYDFNHKAISKIFTYPAGRQALDVQNQILWVASDYEILAFQLPITGNIEDKNNPAFIKEIKSNNIAWKDGGGVDFRAVGLAFDNQSQTLWIGDSQALQRSRVLRITDVYINPKVDFVIGQPDKTSNACNFEGRTARSLCNPNDIKFDKFGNLYITEGVYEARADAPGNKRIIEFDRATINAALAQGMFSLPAADRVYTKENFQSRNCLYPLDHREPCNPIAVNFDSNNKMTVVVDAYYNSMGERFFIYDNPLRNIGFVALNPDLGDKILPVPIGQGLEVYYDDDNIAWIQDHTWNRIIAVNLNNTSPSPSPSPCTKPKSQGNANGDCYINNQDYEIWKANYGSTTVLTADFNNDLKVDLIDFEIWRTNKQ